MLSLCEEESKKEDLMRVQDVAKGGHSRKIGGSMTVDFDEPQRHKGFNSRKTERNGQN